MGTDSGKEGLLQIVPIHASSIVLPCFAAPLIATLENLLD
jgi:hypothetical protein